jgi:uncharacterized protein YkwD
MPFIFLLFSISLTELRITDVNDTTAKMISLYPEIDGDRKVESLLFILTNKERKKRGLGELKFDKRLRIAARQHSNDMLNRKYFSHNSGDKINKTPLHRIYNSGLPILVVGENIAENKGNLVETLLKNNPDSLARVILRKWMNSPAHKENILNPEFTHMGIGSITYKNTQKVTQNFAEEREFSVDSVMAKLNKKRYLIYLYMSSDISGISIFDNGESLDSDSVHVRLGKIIFPLKRNSGYHKIELCLKDEKFYRCGVRFFMQTDSPVENIFQSFSSNYK